MKTIKYVLQSLTRLLRKLKNISFSVQIGEPVHGETKSIYFTPGEIVVHFRLEKDFQETLNAIADAETFTGLPYMKRFNKYTTVIKN